jgi:hypothetical protein
VLEIGSGSVGLGKFYQSVFVGCDVVFTFKPRHPMLPIVASAANLPFLDQSFDAVVASDVLEHIPPSHRPAVIKEALRVARKVVIFVIGTLLPCMSEITSRNPLGWTNTFPTVFRPNNSLTISRCIGA